MVAMVKDIEVPDLNSFDYPNLRAYDGSIRNNDHDSIGGIYASNLIFTDRDELRDTSDKLFKAWYKAYESYIPNYDKSQLKGKPNDYNELVYARNKALFDTLGSIKILDTPFTANVFDSFKDKYVDSNENLGKNIYKFRLLNPIYNKVGKWWVGDKGQPIMAVPNNMDSYDSEPVVPKSYDDYFTHAVANEKYINRAKEILDNDISMDTLGIIDLDILDRSITAKFGCKNDAIPGYNRPSPHAPHPLMENNEHNRDIYRIMTPLEFMSPYNPDVLVPEAKLDELAKDHPEVWKPMIFEYKGYKSICVSTNGYIISAYQPAPNVFLPIHIYGVSDHRGPDGYDAVKSVMITIQNLVLSTYNGQDEIYNIPDSIETQPIDSNIVRKAYNDMINPSERP